MTCRKSSQLHVPLKMNSKFCNWYTIYITNNTHLSLKPPVIQCLFNEHICAVYNLAMERQTAPYGELSNLSGTDVICALGGWRLLYQWERGVSMCANGSAPTRQLLTFQADVTPFALKCDISVHRLPIYKSGAMPIQLRFTLERIW